jgi:hypothetical protein
MSRNIVKVLSKVYFGHVVYAAFSQRYRQAGDGHPNRLIEPFNAFLRGSETL